MVIKVINISKDGKEIEDLSTITIPQEIIKSIKEIGERKQ